MRGSGRCAAVAAAIAAASLAAGCAGGAGAPPADPAARLAGDPAPVPTGRGPAFRLPARPRGPLGAPIAGARCVPLAGRHDLAHLELFARGRVVPIPPGIGVAPPTVRRGARVLGGRCSYPARTLEPTGIVELRRGTPVSLGDVFAIWGQPLSRTRMAGFRGAPVRAYLGGRRWRGDPRGLPLSRHSVVVLEAGPFIAPHARYRFPPGR